MGNPTIAYLTMSLEYLKSLAWPLIFVGVLAVYRPPLGRLLDSLIAKLESAKSVKIGSLSFEVEHQARGLGRPELGREIGQLSFDAIDSLVRTPRVGVMMLMSAFDRVTPHEFGLPGDAELAALRELAKKQLIDFSAPLDPFLHELRANGELKVKERNGELRSSERKWYAVENPQMEMKCRQMGYSLTEGGLKAVIAISKAVAAQLSNSAK